MTPRAAAALAALAAVSACGPTPRPPLLSLGDRACDAAPDLSRAVAVPIDSLRGARVELDATSACLQPADRSLPTTTYAVFALPRQDAPYALTFESLFLDGIVSKPVVSLLDANGHVLRRLSDTEYEQLGSGLRAGMRAGPREAFLVASTDVTVLGNGLRLHYGQDGSFQLASASRTPAPVIITQPPLTPVPASVYPAIYALNGAFHVYALPVPTVK